MGLRRNLGEEESRYVKRSFMKLGDIGNSVGVVHEGGDLIAGGACLCDLGG